MRWLVEFTDVGARDLHILDNSIRHQITDRLEWLSENFENTRPLPLHADWKGYFKLRVGDWRVVYVFYVSRRSIEIQRIERRDKVYKKRT